MPDDRLTRVLRALLPRAISRDLDAVGDDAAFVAEQLERYLTADASAKAEMCAFHEENGLAKVESAVERLAAGAPEREGGPRS